MNIIQLIAHDNYLVVNKTLITKLGLEEAILLGELASEYNYYMNQRLLTKDNYFYSTMENIEANININNNKQRKLLLKLKNLNLIDIRLQGLPAKRYIKLNISKIEELLK